MSVRHTLAIGIATAAIGLTGFASNAAAQLRVGPQLGYNLDSEDPLVGANAWIGVANLSESVQLHASPGLNYYLDDFEGATFARLNLDAKFLYELSGTVRPYGIAGIGIHYAKVEVLGESSSDTDAGLNLGAGALFMAESNMQPFVEFRYALHDEGFAELVGGLLFVF